MNAASTILESSRLVNLIGQVERGETPDLKRVLTLQALDVARLGELFALEVLNAESTSDEQLATY